MTAGSIALNGVTRRFGTHAAVDGVSLSVESGELLALVGASGSGKTTTLRMAAGYESPDEGRVLLDGRDITSLAPQKRGFGMVFQHYALFPHLSVLDNVAFGLEARGIKTKYRRAKAQNALETVGLGDAGGRAVQSLSGGEQQRVALARAVVIEPRVLLLDEPLSNLDPTLRRSMRDELRAMLRNLNVTALFVTHDQEDAFAVADRVALMRAGKLLQVGKPEDLYKRPASREVAEFIGRATLLPATVSGEYASIVIGGSEQRVRCMAPGGHSGGLLAVLRPEMLAIGAADSGFGWRGRIVSRRFAGSAFVYHVALDGGPEVEIVLQDTVAAEGDNVRVSISRAPIGLVEA